LGLKAQAALGLLTGANSNVSNSVSHGVSSFKWSGGYADVRTLLGKGGREAAPIFRNLSFETPNIS
jgi:hypothetical protein